MAEPSWRLVHWATEVFPTLCSSKNDHDNTVSIDFGVQKHFSEQANSQIWNLQIVRLSCLLFSSVSCLLLGFPLLIHCCIPSTKQGQGQDSQ